MNDYHNGPNLGLEPTTPMKAGAAPTPPAQASGRAAPSDDEIEALAIKHIAPHHGKLVQAPYQQTEQFKRIKALILEVTARYGQAPAASAEPMAWPRVFGVSRDLHPRCLMISLAQEPTDDQMRAIHDALKGTSAAAPAAQPAANPEPSDEEILSMIAGNNHPYTEAQFINFARALLSRYGRPARDADEYQAMLAVMEQIDPATFPGLTAAQRCALGRFAKPSAAQAQAANADAGLDVEAVLRLFLTGDGFIAECDIPHIVAALTAQPAINGYTCAVPDDCETLHWRGQILSMNELASMAQPAVGEEIMVNAAHDVFTLPLQPSGLDGQGPRFVVHVPPPEPQAAEIEALRAEVAAMRGALEEIRSRSAMNFAMRPDPFALTAELGDIHQIADAAIAAAVRKEGRGDE